jgi:hypothetical protein
MEGAERAQWGSLYIFLYLKAHFQGTGFPRVDVVESIFLTLDLRLQLLNFSITNKN